MSAEVVKGSMDTEYYHDSVEILSFWLISADDKQYSQFHGLVAFVVQGCIYRVDDQLN